MADEKHIYKVTSGNTVTVVEAPNVTAAAASLGTTPTETTIRRVDTGCYNPTLSDAKKRYEKDPVARIEATKQRERDQTTSRRRKDRDTTERQEPETVEPIAVQPKTITKYQFTLDDGTVRNFEAINQDDADHIVKKWNADLDTLKIIGERPLSQHEIQDALRGAASRSDMDYARALVRYEQVKDVVPVRDGGSGKAILISEKDWTELPSKYQDIVTTKGLEALNTAILKELPISYREIADKDGLEAAIERYNADVERSNIIVHKLKPYKEGDNYDIVTPLQLGVVTASDLKLAGFDNKEVDGVDKYVTRLTDLVDKWETATESGKTVTGLQQGEINDLNTALTEAGMIRRYSMGGAGAELTFIAPNVLADKWQNELSLEDKYNVAEIYAGYPAPARLLASTYRGMIAEAPDMPAATRFLKQFTLGGAAATITPFTKEQIKDNLAVLLKPYEKGGGYNITAFLKDNPEDAPLLLRDSGVTLKNIEDAQQGVTVIVKLKGATAKDWAVSGLIVSAIGFGGASVVIAQPAKSAALAASGLSQLGLGGIATVDTVKYWRQMDSTQRAIAVAFDILLITSGTLSTKAGLTRFKQEAGFLKIKNSILRQYRSARNVIKKILPNKKEAGWILRDIDTAIRTGDVKLLQAAARRLELQAAKMPKQLAEPVAARAKALQAAADDWIQLGKKKVDKGILDSIKGNESNIRSYEKALRRVKRPDRYNQIRKLLAEAVRQNERLKTRLATKEKTFTIPTRKVKWDIGKDMPAKTGKTTAVTKYVPKQKPTTTITVAGKKITLTIDELTRKKLRDLARQHKVKLKDLIRALRRQSLETRALIAIANPKLITRIMTATEIQTATETKTKLAAELKQKIKQQLAPVPFPMPQPKPSPELKPAHELKQEKQLKTKPQLAIYPFFNIPQKVKTRYKRRGRGRDSEPPEVRLQRALGEDPAGVQTWKQGLIYITVFPPYRTTGKIKDVIYSRKKPHYAETSTGRRSPQRTAKAVGGSVPHIITLPMGVVTASVKGGDVLTFQRGGNGQRRKGKGRRRGRLVY
jgi:cell division protein ZapA (FtsZ GTPase activity inhibitor)